MTERNQTKANLSSSEDSPVSDNNCFSGYMNQSKLDVSCSRSIDSDSNSSDDPSKSDKKIENNKKDSNKGMCLMVII